ncbi:MAG: S8 family serine peptidase [Elusimicrobia bacterium]|nr:S8 family serine peptidase [Elusimicrobiota bacterium]
MKKPIKAIILLLFLLIAVSVSGGYRIINAQQKSPLKSKGISFQDYVPGEILVKYRKGFSSSQVKALHAVKGFSGISTFFATHEKKELVYRIKIAAGQSVEDAVAGYRLNPDVEYVQPNYLYHFCSTPNDTDFTKLWGLHNTGQTVNGVAGTAGADIHAPEAWDIAAGTSVITIAVIDSGVALQHPDLAANIWINPREIAGNGIDDDNNGYIDDVNGWDFSDNDNDPTDFNIHGTHVAGTIAAISNNSTGITGICLNVKIMALKIMGVSGMMTTDKAIPAINYAVAKGAKVINASWASLEGTDAPGDLLRDSISSAGNAGVLFVAAAGNDGTNNDSNSVYPANYSLDNIISVAATDQNDNLAVFSNYGLTKVDVAAPGVNIYSTIPTFSFGAPLTIYSKNFDTDTVGQVPSGWSRGGVLSSWAVTNSFSATAPNSLTDSPAGNYSNNTASWVGYDSLIPKTKDSRYMLNFFIKYNLEQDADYLFTVLSPDKTDWQALGTDSWTGSNGGGSVVASTITAVVELGWYFGFGFFSDSVNVADGVYIDNLTVTREQMSIASYDYTYEQGTSMAAPHVSGLAGLLLSGKSNLTVAQLRALILDGVDFKSGLADKLVTGGRINAYNSVKLLNSAPVLSFTGEPNYTAGGLYPDMGNTSTTFVFRVKYTDPNNIAPETTYPKLHIKKNSVEIFGSPFTMTAADTNTYSAGRKYTYSASSLASGNNYTYYLEAQNKYGIPATGTPTTPVDAPDVHIIILPGDAKVFGGVKGYIQPDKGEEAKIRFLPASNGTVKIKIYTLKGDLVWEETVDAVSGVENIVSWACENSGDDKVAPGIYLVHVKGSGVDVKKKTAIVR